MTKTTYLAAALAGAVTTVACGEDVPRYSPGDFYETISITGASFSSDESRIAYTSDQSGVFNAYSVPVTGGKPAALTSSTEDASFSSGYFPNDDRLLYRADSGGNELFHLYVRELDGTERDLTPGENVRAGFAGWSGDFSAFYVQTNERDPAAMDFYRYDATDYSRTLLFENTDGWMVGGISRDGRWLQLAKTITNADSNVYLVDLTSGAEPRLMTPHEGEVQNTPSGFTPDSRRMLYASDQDSEFVRIWSYDIATGTRRVEAESDWDVQYMAYSWNGRYRVTAINEDARTKLSIHDMKSNTPVALPQLPAGEVQGVTFSRSEGLMAYYVNSDTSPSNLYVLDIESGTSVKLTDSMNPKINEAHLVEAEIIRYPSFDGLQIPSVQYKPRQATAENPVPALVFVHGGPGGQSRAGYSAMIQLLCNHGYAVLAVNNRGSSGYGRTFNHADDRDHGGADLQDCVYGRTYLESLDWVDNNRIGIMGGSYGGYMVMAALCFEPEAFDVGINIFGVTNWVRTLESIPPWWGPFRDSLYAELGDPTIDRERLEARSPLLHAGKVVKPVLVVQGANDPRVIQAESDDIVAAVRENGVPVEYVLFPDEGHGFLKKSNRITAAKAYLDFLDRYLLSK